ncbi:MAG: class I SAM-dependent methyltransferase [Solirubrobacteraceae bacterium MAG38_C4-C5]|nr:class I SAM-dependent methyltransferase [Candidatus Siliceabacter maunaloa]
MPAGPSIPPSACPACGGALRAWRRVPGSDPAWPQPVTLLRCASCASAVTDAPAPREVHDAGQYATAAPRGAGHAALLLRAFDSHRLALLRAAGAGPPTRLLDVGAGRGRFVAAARAAGHDARGVEPSARGVAAAQAVYGVQLERATIGDVAISPGSLDAVTIWHVLEHLDDPAGALARVVGWLRPGGVALVGVPNVASLQARLGGPVALHLDVPRHRTHFTPQGLRALLRAHGLEPLRTHHVLGEHNPFGLWQSLVSRATPTPSWLFHVLKRNAPLTPRDAVPTALALPLAPLAAATELLAGLCRRGGTIAVSARRVR